jgi:antitoxin StbD
MNQIFQRVDADLAISISDLKKNPGAAFVAAETQAVAVLNHNRVVGYIISPPAWEGMLEALDDLNILDMLSKQEPEAGIELSLDELSADIHPRRHKKLEQARDDRPQPVRKSAAATRGKPARSSGKAARPAANIQD